MRAKDIMTADVVTIRGADLVAKAIKVMEEKGLHALMVDRRDEADAYGIVTDSDIVYKVIANGKDPNQVRVFEIMTKPCIAVNPNLGVEYVARLFAQNGIHRAPVIQEKLVGIISLTDILMKGKLADEPPALRLNQRIEQAIAEAREAGTKFGPTSKECIVSWDIVEELQAEAAHQRAEHLNKTAFEEYCEEFPEALEARMYEV